MRETRAQRGGNLPCLAWLSGHRSGVPGPASEGVADEGSDHGQDRGAGVTAEPAPARDWTRVCEVEEMPVERGVAALVRGHAVALFRMVDDHVFALGNHDPLTRSSVLARGIVGTRGEVPFVASPVHRQAFDLRTGVCLDDPSVAVSSYATRVVDGFVEVGPRSRA